jgi:hypothetical protein
MARKKEYKNGFHLKFIPSGRMNDLEKLAENISAIKNKTIALAKYVEVYSYILEKYLYTKKSKKFVSVSERLLIKKIGFDSSVVSKILKDLTANNFLEKDTCGFSFKQVQGKFVGIQSWKYKPIYKNIEVVIFLKKFLNKKTDNMLSGNDFKISDVNNVIEKDLPIYYDVLSKTKLDASILEFLLKDYLFNLDCDIVSVNNLLLNDTNNIPISDALTNIYNLLSFIEKSTVCVSPNCTGFVPTTDNVDEQDKNLQNRQIECTGFVPDKNMPYTTAGFIPPELIPVIKLLSEKYKVARPIKYSRVYSNITNLKRCFRPFLRLNGKSLIGFDIANSQPLLATIEFQKFSMQKYGYIKEDVLEYQKLCEEGKFYEYFTSLPELEEIDIQNDEEVRSEFKGIFFGKIFYSKNIEQDNFLKLKFAEKYPTCYEAIFFLKGDKNYSDDYKKFPALMTKLETKIIWESNIELIKQGYDVVNIFDSLYSDSEEAIAAAKHLVLE